MKVVAGEKEKRDKPEFFKQPPARSINQLKLENKESGGIKLWDF